MKKNLLTTFSLLVVLWNIQAQTVTFRDAFSKLDTTRLSTCILYDLVIPKDSFVAYTGLDNAAFADVDGWETLYSWIQFAHLKTCNMPPLQTITENVAAYADLNKIPIGIINRKYNVIKQNAFVDNLLEYHDEYFWDGSNQSVSPYTENRIFTAATLVNMIRSLSPTFVLDENLFFVEAGETIQYFRIDFDDGAGNVTLYANDEYVVTYSSYGAKNIQIEAHCSNGVYICKTALNVEPPPAAHAPSSTILTLSTTYQEETYSGKYKIWYGCDNDEQLKKPLIFVEGFDPTNKNNLRDDGLYAIANQNNLIERLNERGYDVIMLDFASGGAMIQANGMVLRELINTINNEKATDNELVIIGASMGGLVTRYALSYMEFNNEDHHTRLFVSFDSPHQGAYFPLSAQHLVGQLSSISTLLWLFGIPVRDILSLMECDAARQMLAYHHSATDNMQANPHQLRTDFLNELNLLSNTGYPMHCRKIAVAEGSGSGILQDGHQEDEDPYIDINTFVDPFSIKLKMVPLPDQEQQMIFNVDLAIKLHFLFFTITLRLVPSLNNVSVTVNNTKPYDSAPGGYYPIMKDVIGGVNDALQLGLPDYTNKECFIPTMSALDITSSPNLSYNIRANIMNNQNTAEITNHTITPFDAIYAEESNNQHINYDVTLEMVDWLIAQIDPDTLYLQNTVYSSKTIQYEATKQIVAGNNVTGGTQGDVIIKDNSHITFAAGESIVLGPGFSVQAGSSFRAYIKNFSCPENNRMNMVSLPQEAMSSDTNQDTNNAMKIDSPVWDGGTVKTNKINIAPNPSGGMFEISTNGTILQNAGIQIFDLMGNLIYEDHTFTGQKKIISLNHQPAGIYLLQIRDRNGRLTIEKMIKR